jgi:regulator of replication initiation timing
MAQLEASNELQVTWLHCLPFRLTKPTNSSLQSAEDLRGFLAAYEDAATAAASRSAAAALAQMTAEFAPFVARARAVVKDVAAENQVLRREVEDLKKQLQGEQLARQRNDRDIVFLINTVHKLQGLPGALAHVPLERPH